MEVEVGEKVLVSTSGCIYEAVVQEVDDSADEPLYFVHYTGDNSKVSDEWVQVDMLLKHNEENVSMMRELHEMLGYKDRRERSSKPKSLKDEPSPPSRQTSKSGNNGAGNNTNPSTSNSNKKRARDDDDEHHFEGPKMELALPSSIKEELVRDWRFVEQSGRLMQLPCEHTVEFILREFQKRAERSSSGKTRQDIVLTVDGLITWFDQSCRKHLLYKRERKQYAAYITKGKMPSEVYGVVHLLRFLVKLPVLMSYASMDGVELAIIQGIICDFIEYLSRSHNSHLYASVEYVEE
mmetsp:Transcript_8697/g.32061  ORF Transcript_8697/g.32061 Transcript_8697/m.32061 type:complete len:294 (-) Transcript_8697:255-1136(-)